MYFLPSLRLDDGIYDEKSIKEGDAGLAASPSQGEQATLQSPLPVPPHWKGQPSPGCWSCWGMKRQAAKVVALVLVRISFYTFV
jgi:hypothetical protein